MKSILAHALSLNTTIFEVSYTGQQCTKIMSFEEYAKLSVRGPHILNLHVGNGHLLYFGAEHTYDPTDPQLYEIEQLWKDINPTIAFNEGGDIPIENSREETVARHGEAGLVRFLATRDKILVRSIEPRLADEVAVLLHHFPVERIKLFYILRQVVQYRKMKKVESLEDYISKFLIMLSKVRGLEGAPCSLTEFEENFIRTFPKLRNWEEVPESFFNPTEMETFTNDIARKSSQFRDKHMAELLIQEVKKGMKIFALVGFTHVVMQERALLAALE